jgi:WD40 repeat protein
MTPHPYPGLRPFKHEESDIFFGREQHVDQLLEKLGQHHFLAVVGTSGCGKSSLVKAGMLPALEAGFLAQAGAHWYVADLRPGHRPMWALAESLLASQAFGAARGTEPESLALLHATLRRGPLGLVEALCETPLPERANLLVLVDQFEEIFRYRRDIDSQEADAFAALLVASVRQREVNVYIALTMRSDFLGDCAVFLDLPETINESQFLAPRLTRDQRAAAITEPARVFGGDVEPGLVNRMLNDMGADPDQLPLMQHALMRMWDLASGGSNTVGLRTLPLPGGGQGGGDTPLPPSQPSPCNGEGVGEQEVGANGIARVVLDLEHYRKVGGFSEALSSHADEALAELKDEREKQIAERIFKRLTKREEGERDTRDPTTLRELVAITEAPVEEVIRVINVFSQPGRSFLTPHLESSPTPALDTIIDISHESLIRQWGTLKDWVIDEAKSADIYLRLEETARLYQAKNADPYRGLDLQAALEWRKTEKPTSAWAKRYGAKGKETAAFEGAIAFLEESARNREKEQASQERRWRITFFSVCAVMIGALAAAFYVGWLWQTAEAEQNKAIALKLVAEGQLAENRDRNQLQLHALLAIESTKRFPSPLANQSLRHALDLMPRPLTTMLHHDSVSAVALSPDGKTLASGSKDETVRVWDLVTGKELQRWLHEDTAYMATVYAVNFSPDGKTLASGRGDSVRVWDLATGKELMRWLHEDTVYAVSFSPDGKILASGSQDSTVRVWDLATGKELYRLAHEAGIAAISFSPDGKALVSVSWDKTVRAWDLATGKELERLPYEHSVEAISLSPDGNLLGSGSEGNTVRVWDLATGKELHRMSHEAAVNAVSFSPDGKTLVSGSEDATIRLWDLVTSQEPRRWSHDSTVRAMAVSFSPDGRTLASGNVDNTARLWEVATGKELKRLAHEGIMANGVIAVSFSPDGKTLASRTGDNTVRLWDLATGKELKRLAREVMGNGVNAVSFSPDGKTLASGSGDVLGVDNTVRVWDLATGKELQRFSHETTVNAVSFSPDGKTLATWSADNTVRLWDLATGKELQRLSHEATVNAVSFSPDGKFLASGSGDNVPVWDLATGKELQRLSHETTVNAVSFSPDCKTLATWSGDNTVRVWHWQPQDLMVVTCERSTRNLRWNEWRLYFEDLPYSKTCEHLPVHASVIARAQQLAKAGNVAEATALFQRISEIEPSANLDPTAEADRWERKGKLEKILASIVKLKEKKKYAEWMQLAGEAAQLDPTAVPNEDWNGVCWDGALDGQAAVVMRACDQAVERADNDDRIHIRNSRGVARALTGNTEGAIEDFEFFIQHTDHAEQKSQRQAWVGALKAGKNPFTPEVLKSLRGQ